MTMSRLTSIATDSVTLPPVNYYLVQLVTVPSPNRLLSTVSHGPLCLRKMFCFFFTILLCQTIYSLFLSQYSLIFGNIL